MRVIFSRKGFDSSAGKAPSPIVKGRPISLPIPENHPSPTTYECLGHGDLVEAVTRGRINRHANCHDDPMFADENCWFGQSSIAQSHLHRNGVGVGDVFLFFGLFSEPNTRERHHRIFGYMRVACCGAPEVARKSIAWSEPPRVHPHLTNTKDRKNNTLYFGEGKTALRATPKLRLTKHGGPLNLWVVPSWLKNHGLTYHDKSERWIGTNELDSAKRGQEFICNIGDHAEPRKWLDEMIEEITL